MAEVENVQNEVVEETKANEAVIPSGIDKENTRILVTGCTGFVASHVLTQLILKGYKVRGTVRSLQKKEKYSYVDEILERHPEFKHNVEFVEADLLDEESWDFAVKGCEYVMHIASPFFTKEPKDPNVLIKPAVEGTLNVLRAAQKHGVKRVVLTASIVSIMTSDRKDVTYTEADWAPTEGKGVTAYPKSKTLAEKAAWDFVNETKAFELVTIHPGLVLGPTITTSGFTSADIAMKLMKGKFPGMPKFMLYTVDVRDVAKAHILGMEVPEAKDKRFIVVEGSHWMKVIGTSMKNEFKPYGYSIKDSELPGCMVKMAALFDPDVKLIAPFLGVQKRFDPTRSKEVLGLDYHSLDQTLADMGYSLAKHGFVKDKTKGIAAGKIVYE